jgi:hypothetical protein
MALTRADFLRLLPVAVGGEAYRIEGNDIVGEGGRLAWRFRIEERTGRPFGPVALPVLSVQLHLDGATQAQASAFVDRFLLGFQRAGG